jgi:DNA-directed RNA polymerase subunit RPC12/RpoP
MKRFRKPRCPYCGDRLNYAKAWVLKRRGEYICPKCGGLCNVALDSKAYGLGFFAIVLGAAFFLVGLVFDSSLAVVTLSGIFAVFLLFFLISPLLVRLRKPAPPKPRPGRPVPRKAPPAQGRGMQNETSGLPLL